MTICVSRVRSFGRRATRTRRTTKATGFDAIFDDPNFVGGQFSFWNRNGIRLTQTGVGLVQPNSLLPSLRSSKIQGQANFVNPGIFIYNAGVDVEVTQRIKAVFNVNYLRFHRTEPLEYVLFQNRIRHDIGFDYSLGVAYRPFLINNVHDYFWRGDAANGPRLSRHFHRPLAQLSAERRRLLRAGCDQSEQAAVLVVCAVEVGFLSCSRGLLCLPLGY